MSQQQAISDRVRGLIADSGLTQSDFAARCGLDAPKLSKSLSGVRRFTSLDLARIADVAGVTVDWLLGTEPPTPALAGRAASSGGDSVEVAVRMATAFARARADLADLGYRSHPVHLESSQRGKAVDQGARLAAQAAVIFRSAGCEPTARELAPVVEEVFGIDVAVAELPDGFDGLAWRDDDAELIVVGTSTVPARQRFTIAHELGHLLAGDDQRLHLDPNVMDQDHRRQPSEMRANAFAAAFLMPEDLLAERAAKGDVRAFADLADQLSVSPSTLAWRLFNLGLVDERTRQQLGQLTSAQAAAQRGSAGRYAEWVVAAGRARTPTGLIRDSFQAYLDEKATLRPFANLVGVDPRQLRVMLDDPAAAVS